MEGRRAARGTEGGMKAGRRARRRTGPPGKPPKRQQKMTPVDTDALADLMGDTGEDSDVSDDGSGDGGEVGAAGDTEQSEEENAPRATEGGKAWLNVWRWGWAAETWTAFLESLSPSLVVLCASCTFWFGPL